MKRDIINKMFDSAFADCSVLCIAVDTKHSDIFCHMGGPNGKAGAEFHMDISAAVASIMDNMGSNHVGEMLRTIGEVSEDMLEDVKKEKDNNEQELKS